MKSIAVDTLKIQINEAIRLVKESQEIRALAIIDGILAEMKEPPIRISGRETQEEIIWYWLGEARKGLTTYPSQPTITRLRILLKYLDQLTCPPKTDPHVKLERWIKGRQGDG